MAWPVSASYIWCIILRLKHKCSKLPIALSGAMHIAVLYYGLQGSPHCCSGHPSGTLSLPLLPSASSLVSAFTSRSAILAEQMLFSKAHQSAAPYIVSRLSVPLHILLFCVYTLYDFWGACLRMQVPDLSSWMTWETICLWLPWQLSESLINSNISA